MPAAARVPRVRGRVALQLLARRLRALCAFTDVVLGYLPLRTHLLAASNYSSVTLWEVTLSPGGILDASDAKLVRTFRSAADEHFRDLRLDLRSNTLMVYTQAGLHSDTIVFDMASGKRRFSIPRCQAILLSPGGDMLLGWEVDMQDPSVPTFGGRLWNLSSEGAGSEQGFQVGCKPCILLAATFSPAGNDLVVSVVHILPGGGVVETRLELWSVSQDGPTCGVDVASAAPRLAYDGQRIAVCHGRSKPALFFSVRRNATACEFLVDPSRGVSCDDAFLPEGRLLLTKSSTLTVTNMFANVVQEAALPRHANMTHGLLGPGGGVVLAARWLGAMGDPQLFVWDLFLGGGPRLVDDAVRWKPSFSPDGRVIAGIVQDRFEVLLIDVAGGPPVRIRLGPEGEMSSIAVTAQLPV